MAAFALGLVGDSGAREPLEQALGDPSPLVAGGRGSPGAHRNPAAAPAIGRMVAAQVKAGSIGRLAPDDAGLALTVGGPPVRLGLSAAGALKATSRWPRPSWAQTGSRSCGGGR